MSRQRNDGDRYLLGPNRFVRIAIWCAVIAAPFCVLGYVSVLRVESTRAHGPGDAVRAAADMGFVDPVVSATLEHSISTGVRRYGCAEEDVAAYDVAATNVQGDRVQVVACCRPYRRGCAIRPKIGE